MRIVKILPTECAEHMRFVRWLREFGAIYPELLFNHCPNGGLRDIREAGKLKAMGVSAGVPDIQIYVPRGTYHGLAIEMKRVKGGILTIEQKSWLKRLNANGYCAVMSRGCDEAVKIFECYWNLEKGDSI